MSNVKKYLLTAVTLGCIAMASGLLIAGTNMITKDRIAENERLSVNKGIVSVFNDDNAVGKEIALPDGKEYDYVITCYEVKDNNENPLGYAFRTTGSNDYGKVSLIIGFNQQCIYKGLSVVVNEQSFATTLNKGYINLIKNGEKTVDDVSVSCGATFGATLVRNMVNEASQAAKDIMGV